MKYLIAAFFVSFVLNFVIIKFLNTKATRDTALGVQKFHQGDVPRIGGLAIYVSLLVCGILFWLNEKPFTNRFFLVLISALPVFIGGFVEDITKRVSPKTRLFLAFLSGLIAFLLVPARIVRIDIGIFDSLLDLTFVSLIFTSFAVSGLVHAFNIIDGFNGLCAAVSMMVFGTLAYVSFVLEDRFLLYLSLVAAFAVLGFFIWNYPLGLIFLGDGGAYIIGFMIAVIGIIMVQEHKEVSAWFPLVLCAYPVVETIFSIYRKKFVRNISPAQPDGVHLHMLVYKRMIKPEKATDLAMVKRNALTSSYLWFLQLICVTLASLFWRKTLLLVISFLVFVALYLWIYRRIIFFRIPKFLIFKI